MAVPIDLLDPPAVMSSGGLVDASTAGGQVDEEADWCGAVAALVTVGVAPRRIYAGNNRRPSAHPLSERRTATDS